ncbi:isoprenylcysteine carboxylmethyltransferase family protein [Acidobacteria bacterium AH-259-A15]|nr:isoprenylcysteine carboxylmethyltransferase family protein [Acidobacteria bacterium AH-259-A15]
MTTIQKLRVPAGFAYAVLYLYVAQPRPTWYCLGLLVAATGLAMRVWAAGCLEKFQELAISGPYLWSQNPLYFGSFLIGLGFTLAGARVWMVAVFLVLFFGIYLPVMRREEEELLQAYGSEYEAYCRHVPRFWPRPRKISSFPEGFSPSDTGSFQWRRVISNREYRAAVGFLVVAVALFINMQLG